MPGVSAALASLEDVLEVQGCALRDSELWSILCQCAEALQDVLFKGLTRNDGHPAVLVTPQSVLMRPDGRITFDNASFSAFLNTDYCPPEWQQRMVLTERAVEALWIFSLGMTLYKAADYNKDAHEELTIGPDLHTVLSSMCQAQPELRLSLTQIMQSSSNYAARHMTDPFSVHIMRMYEMVFGSSDNISLSNPSSLQSSPLPPMTYDQIRPTPVGTSHNDDSFSLQSPFAASNDFKQHSSRLLTLSAEDSLKLAKLPSSNNNSPTANNDIRVRRPQTSLAIRISPGLNSTTDQSQPPRQSLPNLYTSNSSVSRALKDDYLKMAYHRINERKALLSAIRQSISTDNLTNPFAILAQQQIYNIDDIKASANSLNFGSFHPTFDPTSRIHADPELEVSLPQRPKSAVDLPPRDETDAVLGDPHVREALRMSQRTLEARSPAHRLASISRELATPIRKHAAPSSPNEVSVQKRSRPNFAVTPSWPNSTPGRPRSAKKQPVTGGPEFVRNGSNPIKKLGGFFLPNTKNNKATRVDVMIELLNGERLQFFCASSATCLQLFELLHREVNLPDPLLYGLTHIFGREHFFLNPEKKLEKYIPSLQKRGIKTKGMVAQFTVHQRIRFYPPHTTPLRQEDLRHGVYLQLRRDLLEERLRADDTDIINLAGVALQAEYGDYNIKRHHMNYFVIEYYLPPRLAKQYAKSRQMLVNKHAANAGLNKIQAEFRFIEDCIQIQEYGMHFYTVFKQKNDPLSQMWIGITSRGLAFSEKRGEMRIIVQRCSWANIAKISFNKERFTIKPYEYSDDPNKIHRYTESYKKSKYLIWLAQQQHQYFVETMSRGDNFISAHQPTEPMSTTAIEADIAIDDDREGDDLVIDYSDDEPQLYQHHHEPDAEEASSYQYQAVEPEIESSEPETDEDTIERRKAQASTLPRRSSSRRRELEEHEVSPSRTQADKELRARLNIEPGQHQVPSGDGLTHNIEETMSESLHARFDAIPTESPEKRIHHAKLYRTPQYGIGLTLAPSKTGNLFIKSIVPGGPASKEGSLKLGDRIISINRTNVEGVPTERATDIIRQSKQYVELVVAQIVDDQLPTYDVDVPSGISLKGHSEGSSSIVSYDEPVIPANQSKPSYYSNQLKSSSIHPPSQSTAPPSEPPIDDRAEMSSNAEQSVSMVSEHHNDLTAQYRTQAAKYHPKQRHPQPPTVPIHPDTIFQQHSPQHKQSALRQQLDDLSSQDPTPVPDQQVTNIDDMSSDMADSVIDDDIDEASALKQAYRQQLGQQLSSLRQVVSSSSEAEGPARRPEPTRASAFAAPSARAAKPPSSWSETHEMKEINSAPQPHTKGAFKDTALTSTPSLNRNSNRTPTSPASSFQSSIDSGPPVTLAKPNQEVISNTQGWREDTIVKSEIGDSEDSDTIVSEDSGSDELVSPNSLTTTNEQPDGDSADQSLDEEPVNEETEDEEVTEMMLGHSKDSDQKINSGSSSAARDSAISQHDQKLKTPVNSHLKIGDPYRVTLHKVNQSLGLNVTGGINTSVLFGSIYVKTLVPLGPSDQCARIQIGDRVVRVNGNALIGVTHKQAVETLRSTETPVTLDMERGEVPNTSSLLSPATAETPASEDRDIISPGTRSASPHSAGMKTPDIEKLSFISPENCCEVVLKKGNSGLGFSVLGGKDPMSPDPRLSLVRVKKMFPQGPAAKSGQLQVGDVILRVNGRSVEGLSHSETVSLLRAAPPEVRLYICRIDPRILSPVSERLLNIKANSSPTQTKHQLQQPTSLPNTAPTVTQQQSASVMKSLIPNPSRSSPVSHQRLDTTDTRSSISAASTTTIGTQESSTSKDSVNTILKSPAVQEFEESLKAVKADTEFVLPTPIKELDDVIVANTSSNTSRTGSPPLSQEDFNRIGQPVPVNFEGHKLYINNVDRSDSGSSTEVDEEVESSFAQTNEKLDDRSSDTMPELQVSAEATQPITDPELTGTAPGSREPSPQLIEVILKKDEFGSLGFSIAGTASLGGIYIKKIIKDPALTDGRLKSGDKLIEVNGNDVTKLTNNKAFWLIKSQPEMVHLKVRRPLDDTDIVRAYIPSKPPREEPTVIEGAGEEEVVEAVRPDISPMEEVIQALSASTSRANSIRQSPALRQRKARTPEAFQDDSDFSSVGDDENIPDNLDDSWSDDSRSETELVKETRVDDSDSPEKPPPGPLPDSKIDTPCGTDSDTVAEADDLPDNASADDGPNERSSSVLSRSPTLSWGDSATLSVEEKPLDLNSSISPVDLRRRDSHKSATDGPTTSGISRNPSTSQVSRTESLNSAGSFLSSPNLSRQSSFKYLGRAEDRYKLTLNKPDNHSLGFSMECKNVDGRLRVFVKTIADGGLADVEGQMTVGDQIIEVNGEPVYSRSRLELVTKLQNLVGDVELTLLKGIQSQSEELGFDEIPESGPDARLSIRAGFGPSVTTTDDDSEIEGLIGGVDDDEVSDVLKSLASALRPDTATETNADESRLTDDTESSFDFDLPDESHYLESSIRLTREDMRSPRGQSLRDSDTETDAGPNNMNVSLSTRYDTRPDDTETEGSARDYDITPGKRSNSFAGLPGTANIEEPHPTRSTKSAVELKVPQYSALRQSADDPYSFEITQEWIESLAVLTINPRGLYTDSSLESIISQLLAKVANDEPYEDFKQLKSLKPTDSCEAAKLPENKVKNRFRNVLPYDATRVILNNEENYINANHVQKAMGKDAYHYIASQGPLPQTSVDFWEMVVEQGVSIIAMTTCDVEGGKVKCHRYWPDSLNAPLNIEDVYEITLTKITELKHFDIRYLTAKDLETGTTQKVIHLNYTQWPDHGMPRSAMPILQYIRLIHELHNSGPILVHCSAGIGRTGTLITLDIILGSVERDLKFDIHQIVMELRRQRPGMIQTKDQYLFCYTAAVEALELLKKGSKSTA